MIDRTWHHNNSKLSSWADILKCHVKFGRDTWLSGPGRVQAAGLNHHDADQSQLVRGLYIVMVYWHFIYKNIKYFVKVWF